MDEDLATEMELRGMTGEVEPEIVATPVGVPIVIPDAIKRERRIFKGQPRKLVEIVDMGNLSGTPVQVIDRTASQSQKMPGLLIIDKVIKSWLAKPTDPDWVEVRGWSPRQSMRPVSFHARKDNVVNLLQGRMGEQLRTEHRQWQRGNVAQSVPATPMNLGADPEVFVTVDDQVLPAWEFLPGKDAPALCPEYAKQTMYWDGFQAEYTIGVTTCLSFTVDYIRDGLVGIQAAARKKDPRAKLSIGSVLPVDMQVLQDAELRHVEFGCMPSKNAYGLAGRVEDPRSLPFRFAGGHIHLGLDTSGIHPSKPAGGPVADKFHADEAAQKRAMRAMDSILGVACVSLFEHWDNPVRREYYGLPGEYRLPKHGVEYRTLSNAWLAHPTITNLVYELARRAFNVGYHNRLDVWEADEQEVVECILASDVRAARAILGRNLGVLQGLLSTKLWSYPERAALAFTQDMSEIIKDPADIEGNWLLSKPGWTKHNEGPEKRWGTSVARIMAGDKL